MIEAFVQELLVILLVFVTNTVLISASRYSWVSDMVWCVENLVAGSIVLPCV